MKVDEGNGGPQYAAYELGKHMAKLTVADEGATVILRPRYALAADRVMRLHRSINEWRRSTGAKVNVLIMPHDLDIFVVAGAGTNEDEGASDVGSDPEDQHQDGNDGGDGGGAQRDEVAGPQPGADGAGL